MRRLLLTALLLAAGPALATFPYSASDPAIPAAKTDQRARPQSIPATQWIGASDYNALRQGVIDLQTAVIALGGRDCRQDGVLCDGSTDDASAIQTCINTVGAAGGGTAILPPGVCLIGTPLTETYSNVYAVGYGEHATTIKMAATMTAASSSAITFYNSTVGTSRALTRNSTIGDTWVNVSTSDAASFTAGDYVLVRSLQPAEGGSALTGTATFTNASTTVVGVGTSFTTATAVGRSVRPVETDQWYAVSAITDNTHLTLSTAFAGTTVAGATIEPGSTSKFIGEVHRIVEVDSTAGVLRLEDALGDDYTTLQGGSVLKVTVLQNVGLHGVAVTHAASSAPSINVGAVVCRLCRGAMFDRLYVHDVFNTAVDLYSSIDTTLRDSRIEDVRSASSATVYYGVWIASASRNITIQNNRFSRMRHSVTTGTHSVSSANTLSLDGREGVQRNILVAHNTSYASTTAHYDTHQPAESVTFLGNQAYGAWPEGHSDVTKWGDAVYGIQGRANKTNVIGNMISFTRGGIFLFGYETKDSVVEGNVVRDQIAAHYPTYLSAALSGGEASISVHDARGFSASGTVYVDGTAVTYTGISSNTLTGCSGTPAAAIGKPVIQWNGGGHGIVMDSAAQGPGLLITGNAVYRSDGACVSGTGGQSRVSITNNLCKQNSLGLTTYPSIRLSSAGSNVDVSWNRIEDNPKDTAPIQISGSGNSHRISWNYLYGNARTSETPSWVGASTQVLHNFGYIEGIAGNPWPVAPSTDLIMNIGSGGQANPDSATTYTVRTAPCQVLVKAGTVSSIAINGSVTNLTGGIFRLAVGDTIKVTYSAAPTTAVWWE